MNCVCGKCETHGWSICPGFGVFPMLTAEEQLIARERGVDCVFKMRGEEMPKNSNPLNPKYSPTLMGDKFKSAEKPSNPKDPAGDAKIRTFESGATRDRDEHKNDYEGFFSPLVFRRYGDYMQEHRLQKDGSVRDSDNWQKGMGAKAFVKSKWRHFVDIWTIYRGYRAIDFDKKEVVLEDALCADIFNTMGYLHEILLAKEIERLRVVKIGVELEKASWPEQAQPTFSKSPEITFWAVDEAAEVTKNAYEPLGPCEFEPKEAFVEAKTQPAFKEVVIPAPKNAYEGLTPLEKPRETADLATKLHRRPPPYESLGPCEFEPIREQLGKQVEEERREYMINHPEDY
jgi:hypothetical protein